MNTPRCDMEKGCSAPVQYIDHKGFVYCSPHGALRKQYCRCRKLKPQELVLLKSGKPLPKY